METTNRQGRRAGHENGGGAQHVQGKNVPYLAWYVVSAKITVPGEVLSIVGSEWGTSGSAPGP